MKWLVFGFFGIAIIGSFQKGTPGAPNRIQEAFSKAGNNLAPDKLLPLEDYKNLVFPERKAYLRVADTAIGSGVPAVCGQTAKIAYEAFLQDDSPVGDKAGKESPLSIHIGERTAMAAFEQGVIGMKAGGKRRIYAPYSLAYGQEGFARGNVPENATVRFEVELLETAPALPDVKSHPYRISPIRNGTGVPVLCGDPAKIHVTLWGMDGKKLFTTMEEGKEPLQLTPGKSEVFLGLEQGVIGMQTGGARLLVIPPAFQKTMSGEKPAIDFPLPENQTILVDVEAMP